jgi:hypothetical protein
MTVEVTKKQAEQVLSQVKKKYKWAITEECQPTLIKNFEWSAGVVPYAVVWEGGPYEWVYESQPKVQGVWTEAYTGWAMSIYKNWEISY